MVEHGDYHDIAFGVFLDRAETLTGRGIFAYNASFNLYALGTGSCVSQGVVTFGAWRQKLKLQQFCGDILSQLAGNAQWLAGEAIIFGSERFYSRENFSHSLGFLPGAHGSFSWSIISSTTRGHRESSTDTL